MISYSRHPERIGAFGCRHPNRPEGPCLSTKTLCDSGVRSFAALRTTGAFPSTARLLDGIGPDLGPIMFFGCLLNIAALAAASAAGGDLGRQRYVRLLDVGGGDCTELRCVLELALVALRHRL